MADATPLDTQDALQNVTRFVDRSFLALRICNDLRAYVGTPLPANTLTAYCMDLVSAVLSDGQFTLPLHPPSIREDFLHLIDQYHPGRAYIVLEKKVDA